MVIRRPIRARVDSRVVADPREYSLVDPGFFAIPWRSLSAVFALEAASGPRPACSRSAVSRAAPRRSDGRSWDVLRVVMFGREAPGDCSPPGVVPSGLPPRATIGVPAVPCGGRRSLARVQGKRTEDGRLSRERSMAALLPGLLEGDQGGLAPRINHPHLKGVYTWPASASTTCPLPRT